MRDTDRQDQQDQQQDQQQDTVDQMTVDERRHAESGDPDMAGWEDDDRRGNVAGQPLPADGTTQAMPYGSGQPTPPDGTPLPVDGTPLSHEGTPLSHEGTPLSHEGTPLSHDGTPMSQDSAGMPYDGDAMPDEGDAVWRADDGVSHEDSTRDGGVPPVAADNAGHDGAMAPFPADAVERFRARWREVQADFVDDPQRAVHEAEEVADEVLRTLTEHRQRLSDGWQDRTDTEDLRLALREYRSFIDGLLPT
jgi:hypothetical protein